MKKIITSIEKIRFEMYLRFIWMNFLLLTEVFCLTPHLKFPRVGFSVAGLDREIRIKSVSILFCLLLTQWYSILLKTAVILTSLNS